ncbi:MAG: hypothetical protein ACI4FX_05220 [Agathobacter sp.]
MDDHIRIEMLGLPTITNNALHGAGVQTVGDLKKYIRIIGCGGIRNIGTSGWYNIAQAVRPYVRETETKVMSAIENVLADGKLCTILRKGCPADGNCPGCELHAVYERYKSLV